MSTLSLTDLDLARELRRPEPEVRTMAFEDLVWAMSDSPRSSTQGH